MLTCDVGTEPVVPAKAREQARVSPGRMDDPSLDARPTGSRRDEMEVSVPVCKDNRGGEDIVCRGWYAIWSGAVVGTVAVATGTVVAVRLLLLRGACRFRGGIFRQRALLSACCPLLSMSRPNLRLVQCFRRACIQVILSFFLTIAHRSKVKACGHKPDTFGAQRTTK